LERLARFPVRFITNLTSKGKFEASVTHKISVEYPSNEIYRMAHYGISLYSEALV
jgi:hypothetical protein